VPAGFGGTNSERRFRFSGLNPLEQGESPRPSATRNVGPLFVMFLFFAASTMNLLYLHIPENHISDITLLRGYLLKP
jgi:hypothetical protein